LLDGIARRDKLETKDVKQGSGQGQGPRKGPPDPRETEGRAAEALRVLLHNDDYTTQEFVVYVLMKFFHHDAEQARQIMLHVHTKGIGVAGVYTYDVAETKASQTVRFAREHEMPLQCSIRRREG
jgi:ATP-dependent Clp protease adaptor protein ClpS